MVSLARVGPLHHVASGDYSIRTGQCHEDAPSGHRIIQRFST